MTNTKSTKRALLVSVMAMVICFTMLLGTTFAWFTDSAKSEGNVIKAGELELAFKMHNGSTWVDITDATAPLFGEGSLAANNDLETLWEPNKTQVVYLSVTNTGNLDFKFEASLVVDATGGLYEVIEYAMVKNDLETGYVTSWVDDQGADLIEGKQVGVDDEILEPGDTCYFALVLHMISTAGNNYMNKVATFDINILATQVNTEKDEFGPDYDKNATYPAP